MKIDIDRLRHRILQPTRELMAEVGEVREVGGQLHAHRDTGAPILGVAHCDYVDRGSDHFECRNGRVYSSRLDDRLGVYVLLDLLPQLGIKTDILLTDDEESGRSSAKHFHTDRQYNWMFQFDRRGADAVCYEYMRFEPIIGEFFDVGIGTFSDICWLNHTGCCGVNVGTAYYKEHTLDSYAILGELKKQVRRFAKLYDAYKDTFVPYTAQDRQTYDNTYEGWCAKREAMGVYDECDYCGWQCDESEMVDYMGGRICEYCAEDFRVETRRLDREYGDIINAPWELE